MCNAQYREESEGVMPGAVRGVDRGVTLSEAREGVFKLDKGRGRPAGNVRDFHPKDNSRSRA